MGKRSVPREIEATVVGVSFLDRVFPSDRLVSVGDKFIQPAELKVMAGGMAARVAWALAEWGLSAALVSAYGKDEAGRRLTCFLQKVGVNLRWSDISRSQSTGESFIVVEPTGRRTVFAVLPAGLMSQSLPPNEIKSLAHTRILSLDGSGNIDLQVKFATEARANAQTTIVLNLEGLNSESEKLIPLADVVAASQQYFKVQFPDVPIESALETLAAKGPWLVGFTFGAAGSIFLDLRAGQFICTPAFAVQHAVDETAAGDIFHAGLGGVTVSYTGPVSGSVVTNLSGQYSIANAPLGSYSLTPARTGFSFQAMVDSFSVSGPTVRNFTGTGQPATSSFLLGAAAASANAGSNGTSTVTITPVNGFNSGETLVASGWPSGITGTFGTNPAFSTSALAISVGSSVAAGSYTLAVIGTSGALTINTAISLTVNIAGGGLPGGVAAAAASGAANVAQNLRLDWASPIGQPALVYGWLLIQDSAFTTPATGQRLPHSAGDHRSRPVGRRFWFVRHHCEHMGW